MKKKNPKNNTRKKKIEASDRQFFWLVILIVSLIVLLIVVPIAYKRLVNTFEYGGVKFEKIKQGQIIFYHGISPNWVVYSDGTSTEYNFYFRTDPRKNNISINTSFSLTENVIISLEPGVELCQHVALANPQLANFISSFPFVTNLSSGVNDRKIAEELNRTFADCSSTTASTTVLIIQKSETPSIEFGNRKGCFILNVGDCEYLETIE